MNVQTGSMEQLKPSLAGDLWGGLTAMLVALPSSIAFGVLTYSVLGPQYAGMGAMAGIIGAAALGVVSSFLGRTGGLITAPCAPAAAVLSAMIAGLLGGKAGTALPPSDILPILFLTVFLAALLQILYGAVGGGRLIKFIPYPVVTGFLSGVGLLIALDQIPKLFGFPPGTPLFRGLLSPVLWRWEGLLVGLITILLVAVAPRLTKKIPAVVMGLLGGITAYVALGLFFPDLLSLQGNPLVIGPVPKFSTLIAALAGRTTSLRSINISSSEIVIIPALTLSILLSIDTLKTCVGLDALTHSRHKSNRELIGQGIGNLASCLGGGMPGAGTMGPTLVNVASGGRTFRSGMIEGGLVVMVLLFLSPLIAWVPIAALAGILLVIAWWMFDVSMLGMLKNRERREDFAVIACVVLVSVTVDLIAASGVGVALAIALFIRDQIRGTVIRRKLYLNQISSKTQRLAAEREILNRNGDQGVFCELYGDLFFGTADQLYTLLEPDLRTKRYILLDMRRVHSMDSTAAHFFELMHGRLAERGGQLLFSGMPSGLLAERNFERYLVELGVVKDGGGVMISETLDAALEWMEDRILEEAGVPKKSQDLMNVQDFELFQGLDEQALHELTGCMREISLDQGEKAVSRNEKADELFLIRRGSVRIMLPLRGGQRHHLATIGQGDFFGEISFLRRRLPPGEENEKPCFHERRIQQKEEDRSFLERRSHAIDVEAKTPTDLYVLSRARFDVLARSNPALGVRFFSRLATAVSERLRRTNAELQILEDR